MQSMHLGQLLSICAPVSTSTSLSNVNLPSDQASQVLKCAIMGRTLRCAHVHFDTDGSVHACNI